MNNFEENTPVPRRCAASEIKLLRLDLFSHSKSICEDIGNEWNHAQPAETLSPARASEFLGVEMWAIPSVVKKRYKTLQLRYPPEQFSEKHLDWRPSYELLSSPRKRLNWFWQSGFVPDNGEPVMSARMVLQILSYRGEPIGETAGSI